MDEHSDSQKDLWVKFDMNWEEEKSNQKQS